MTLGLPHILTSIELREFDNQIAGHKNEKFLSYRERFILKPRIRNDLFQREINFYEDIFGDAELVNSPQRRFFAEYHGVVHVSTKKSHGIGDESDVLIPYIMLNDLTASLGRPCVIDIKMGRQTFEPSASKEKIDKELKKYPYQSEIGYRLSGFKVWDDVSETYHFRNKAFGRMVVPEQITHALASYFFDGKGFRVNAISHLLLNLEELLVFMKTQKKYRFFSSSILIAYDADRESHEICRCVMIDFAHVVRSDDKVDEDYIFGIEKLIVHLRKILETISKGNLQQFITEMLDVFVLAS